VRIKNYLVQTNGYYAVKARDVINSGAEFVKHVQSQNHQAFNLGNLDRMNKDRKMVRTFVVITEGQYKGLKGRVMFADD
jgi:hypothetical protein